MLTGEPLFGSAETADDMYAKVLELCGMDGPELHASLRELSEAGHEVLRGLLSFKAEKRLTAAEALSHRWFDEEDAPLSTLCSQPDRRGLISFF